MIRAKAQLVDPDSQVMTITITATVGEWRCMLEDLDSGKHPVWCFRKVIHDCVSQADKQFTATHEFSQ